MIILWATSLHVTKTAMAQFLRENRKSLMAIIVIINKHQTVEIFAIGNANALLTSFVSFFYKY